MTSASTDGTNTNVIGSLAGESPNSLYTVQFFANTAADPAGFLEGQTFLGTTTVMTDATGAAAINITLPTPVGAGQLVTATATDPVGNTSPFSGGVAAIGTADVSVSIQSSPAQVQVGQNLTYTLTVTNNGPTSARGVVVTDTLPAGVTYVSSTSTQGSAPTQASGVVTAVIGTMAANSTATVTIVVKTTINAAPSVTDTASVVSQETDPTPANNTATITSAVTAVADLSVSLNGDKSPVLVGQNLTYTVTASNAGPSTATGVTLKDTLPAGVAFVSATSSTGDVVTLSNGVLTVVFSSLASGASDTMTIVVKPGAGTCRR